MRLISSVTCLTAAAACCSVQAQSPAPATAPPVGSPTGQKSLAATLNVSVFPSAGQTSGRQSKDEGDCYN
jgi:hypothetical protein